MPETDVSIVAENADSPTQVLITKTPLEQFDPTTGIVVLHSLGTNKAFGPMTLQSALARDEWRQPERGTAKVKLDSESSALLDMTAELTA